MRVEGAPYPLGAPLASWAPRVLSGLRFLAWYFFWSVKIHYIISRRFWPPYHDTILCFCFELFLQQIWSKISSQESVGESRVSHPTPWSKANSDADHFGPSTEEEMDADLKRIDAMEEDQEVTSRLQARFMMEELQSSTIPNSVIPPMLDFLLMKIWKRDLPYLRKMKSKIKVFKCQN